MNKQALATIFGVALLGLAKKGSKSTMSMSDYAKLKTDNAKGTFKIHFSFNFKPIFDDNYTYYDFSEYFERYKSWLNEADNDWENLQEIADHLDKESLWDHWSEELDDGYLYFNEDLEERVAEYYDMDEFEELCSIYNNAEFSMTFQNDRTNQDIHREIVESWIEEVFYWELEECSSFTVESISDLSYGDEFLSFIEDEFDLDNLESQKENVLKYLKDNKDEFYPDYYVWDWEDYHGSEAGYASGCLEVSYNINTISLSLYDFKQFIMRAIDVAYHFWMQEVDTNRRDERDYNIDSIDFTVEPKNMFSEGEGFESIRRR